MRTIPRDPERTATPEELAEDRRRHLQAKPRIFAPIDEDRLVYVALNKCVRKGCEIAAGPRSIYCDRCAKLRATHGKNGRPNLQAVRP